MTLREFEPKIIETGSSMKKSSLQIAVAADYQDRGDENRKLCRLHIALLDRMGLHVDHFGDADKALSDLG